MFHSDFDPPPQTSVRGLIGIVAAVLTGIGVTVAAYLWEDGPRTVHATEGEPAAIERFEAPQSLQQAPLQHVEPVQYRSRPQASLSPQATAPASSASARGASAPAAKCGPKPACPAKATAVPSPTEQANAECSTPAAGSGPDPFEAWRSATPPVSGI